MEKSLDLSVNPVKTAKSPGFIRLVATICPPLVVIAFLCCPLLVWLLLQSMAFDEWARHDAATATLLAVGGLPAMAGLMDMWRRRDGDVQLDRFLVHTLVTPLFGGAVTLLSVFAISNVPSIHSGIAAQGRHVAEMYSDPVNALLGGFIFAVIVAYAANGLFAFLVWWPVSSFVNPGIVMSGMFFSDWYFDTRTAEGKELKAQHERLRVWQARVLAVATTLIGITIMVGLTASGWTEDAVGRGLHHDIVGAGLAGSLSPDELQQLSGVMFWWLLAACILEVALSVPIRKRRNAIRQRSLEIAAFRYDPSDEPEDY